MSLYSLRAVSHWAQALHQAQAVERAAGAHSSQYYQARARAAAGPLASLAQAASMQRIRLRARSQNCETL
jgi:hypothetical protein